MRGSRVDYDRAYGAFLVSGLAALVVRGFSMLPMDTGTAGGIGILVAVPLYLIALLAMIVGIAGSFRLYDDRWLLLLAALALAFIANFLLEFVPMPLFNAVPVIFGIIVLSVSARWFLGPRRKRLT